MSRRFPVSWIAETTAVLDVRPGTGDLLAVAPTPAA
jgi:hypothetical protein